MPEWKEEIGKRLESLKLAPVREAEIVDELAQHLEDRYQELLAGGVDRSTSSPHGARRAQPQASAGSRTAESGAPDRPGAVVLGMTGRRNVMGDL